MAKLYIICGHGAGDPGAIGCGYNEAERVRELAKAIKAKGGDAVEVLDTSRNWFRDGGISRLSLPARSDILELHLDSYPSAEPHGGHVIIKPGFDPDARDSALADFIANMFPGRAERLTHQQLSNADRAAAKDYPYRLLECCFVTHADDMAKFDAGLDELASGILDVFAIAPSTPSTPPANPSTDARTGFGGTYRCTVNGLNVRTSPRLGNNIVPNVSYNIGDTVRLDDWYKIADGWVWGRYTGASSGKKRYIAVGKPTGGPAADDYLVRI